MSLSASADVRQTLPHLLARRGLRLTGPRRAVLDVLAESREPLTVAEIHQRLGGNRAHVVSVYRTVHLLGHHHHLICQGCGRIEDLDGCWLADAVLTRLTRYVRRTRRFEVSEHEVRLFGLCQRCAT
jgi:Fur family ferric uptake transcriptional regulator